MKTESLFAVEPYAESIATAPVPVEQPEFAYYHVETLEDRVVPTAVNGLWVQELYNTLLDRDASLDEVQSWANSGLSANEIVNGFLTSAEWAGNTVTDLYADILGRDADQGGFDSWVAQLQNGNSLQNVYAGFFGSEEFFNDAGGTNETFVAALYNDILGRDGSTEEIAGWVNGLNSGLSTFDVALGFVTSPEFYTEIVDVFYFAFLGRESDPSGFDYWTSTLEGGASLQQVINGFLSSNEFFTFSLNPWVGSLYNEILGRDGSAEEIAGWVNNIFNGMSFVDVVEGFNHSTENATTLVEFAYGIILGRPADPTGLQQNVDFMTSGGSFEVVLVSLLSSDEFFASTGSDFTTFVTDLYEGILGRTPSQAEVDQNVALLQQGVSRQALVEGFFNSPEFDTNLVNDAYLDILGRDADPSGFDFWFGKLQSGAEWELAEAGFFSSPEYFNNLFV